MHICMGKTQKYFWGGNPLPRPHPLGAYGASIIAPSALMFSPTKPEIQTPPMLLILLLDPLALILASVSL